MSGQAIDRSGVDVSAVEALGYTVTICPVDDVIAFPYLLEGKRGAQYGLMPNMKNPRHLFAVNARRFTASARPGGYEWFSDEGGVLRPLR